MEDNSIAGNIFASAAGHIRGAATGASVPIDTAKDFRLPLHAAAIGTSPARTERICKGNGVALTAATPATGNNIHAAKYSGMKENRNIVLTMMIAGALAGMGAGLLYLTGIEEWETTISSTSSALIFPSSPGMGSTLCPVASTAPVSWTLMCPVSAAITP